MIADKKINIHPNKFLMRAFVLYARKGITAPQFSLNDLAGSAGRLDIVARCVTQALWLSHKLRQNIAFYVVLAGAPDPPKTVGFFSDNIKRLSPDERNVGSWIKKALEAWTKEGRRAMEKGGEWVKVQEGIYIAKKDVVPLVKELKEMCNYNIFVLHEKGEDIRRTELQVPACFVIGDHIGLPKKVEDYLVKNLGARKISVGPESYLASSCIAVVHNELDRSTGEK